MRRTAGAEPIPPGPAGQGGPEPIRARLGRLRPLLPFFGLYVSFGATFGFLTGGAPLILRARGVELAQVGLLQVMNLPLGLTFLWAVLVDRVRLPGLPHRVGWIAAMQGLAVALLAILAVNGDASLGLLFGLGTAICFCVATMDVSLEALVVETVAATDRVLVSSAKFCGASVGGVIGAGVLVGSFERIGWTAATAAVAILAAVAIPPILLYPERLLRRPEAVMEHGSGRLGHLRELGRHVLVLGLYFAALQAISGFNGFALQDAGLSLGEVGLVTGTVMPLLNLVMSALAAPLVRRVGTVRLITFGAAGLLVAATGTALALASGSGALAAAATLATYLCSTLLGVPVFNMLYRWAEGPRAAADYALLFGAAFFASMPVRIGGPAVAAAIGWAPFFGLAILFYGGAFLLLRSAVARTLATVPIAAGARA